ADGSLDATFNPVTGAFFSVYSTALQPDGKIIIGGQFTSYNGTARNRIARLNADGSLDATFNPGTGANNSVWPTALQPDGKIIIVGNFTNYNGTARQSIARLNANGTLDTAFNPGSGAFSDVSCLTLQADGKIIIGGSFITYNDIARNNIARANADGSADATFIQGTSANNSISTIAIQPDGKIIIGGFFAGYNGTARNGIARLNTDGTLDATFNTGTGPGNLVCCQNSSISHITLQPDGKIIVGGAFTAFNGTARNFIARLNVWMVRSMRASIPEQGQTI
ncbi:MAG: delta-60 repeat domain-containing protein, partial [Flavobacteriales bacterium]